MDNIFPGSPESSRRVPTVSYQLWRWESVRDTLWSEVSVIRNQRFTEKHTNNIE